MQTQEQRARVLRELHTRGPVVLPNAWDPGSAVAIEAAGAQAIATTSGGVAWATGVADGGGLTRSAAVEAVRRIVAVVSVPVTADIESGYGDVAATVAGVIEAGAVGVNIEDSPQGILLSPEAQAEVLAAARKAARGKGLFINARTDTYLAGTGSAEERLADTMVRARVYAEAGADSLFVPGVVDKETIATLVSGPLPVNVMVHPGALTVPELVALGVARISVGTAIAQAAYGLAAKATRELLSTGTYGNIESDLGYGELNNLLS